MYIPNDDSKKNLMVEKFGHYLPTDQDLIKVPKVFQLTNLRTFFKLCVLVYLTGQSPWMVQNKVGY